MSDKLISDLSSAAILVTDLLEHQPIAGPPSKKGTVTALFTVGAQLAIDRDNRILIDSGGDSSVDWENRQLANSVGALQLDWEAQNILDGSAKISVQWNVRKLLDSAEASSIEWQNRIAFDSSEVPSFDWGLRHLIADDGSTVVLDFSTQQPSSGAQTAGAIYTATEQTMLQEAYDALLAYGLLAP